MKRRASVFIFTNILLQCFNTFAQQSEIVGDENENLFFCRFPTSRSSSPPPEHFQQGRPGKLGPTGAPGPKGDRGVQGICGCNPNEIEQLNMTIQSLTETLNYQSATIQKLTRATTEYFVDNCSVGMKYGDTRVRDQDITASTYHPSNFQPYRGRLGRDGIHSAWAASQETTGDWLQVDLQEPKSVTGVITEGRGDTTHGEQWVSSYKISYSNSSTGFQVYEDENGAEVVFSQPTRLDRTLHFFRHPITARYFRLIVQTYVLHPSLRMDYITC